MPQRRRFALLKQTTGLDSLVDVVVTAPVTTGSVLQYDGTVWANVDLTTFLSGASHQLLGSLQGGTTTERYHLSATQAANLAPAGQHMLVDGGSAGEDGSPGPQGLPGAAGAQGQIGPAGPAIYLEADAGEQGEQGIPGGQGPAGVGNPGPTGAPGPMGPAIYLDADGNEGDMGPPGPAGPAGAAGSPGYSAGILGVWRTDTTVGGDPASGRFRWDNATQISASIITVDHLDSNSNDIDVFFELLALGDRLYIQDQNDSTNYQIWQINGAVTGSHALTYHSLPVLYITSSGTGTTNFPDNHSAFIATSRLGNQGLQGPPGFADDGVDGADSMVPGPPGPVGPAGATGPTGPAGSGSGSGGPGPQGEDGQDGDFSIPSGNVWTWKDSQTFTAWQIFADGLDSSLGYIQSKGPAVGSIWVADESSPADEKWFGMEVKAASGRLDFAHTTDAGATQKSWLSANRNGNKVDAITFSNTTDLCNNYTFYGLTSKWIGTTGVNESVLLDVQAGNAGIYIQSTAYAAVGAEYYGTPIATPGEIYVSSGRGTSTAKAAIQTGDTLPGFNGYGIHTGLGFAYLFKIIGTAQTVGAASVAGDLDFQLSAAGAAPTSRMKMKMAGPIEYGTDVSLNLDLHSTSPATPSAGRLEVYAKADKSLYIKDSTGLETNLVTPGPAGPALFMLMQDGEEGDKGPPGPVGATGAAGAGAPTSYTPGSITVATGNFAIYCNHLQFTGTQRATVAGTGRLRISN